MTLFGDTLFTLRLELKRVQLEHLEQLALWCASAEAYGQFLTPEQYSYMQLRNKLESGSLWSEQNKIFLIQLREGPAIGTAHYWLRSEDPETAVMALKIACPEERCKGYGTEVQKYMIMFLFDRLNLRQIEMYTDINNRPQQRCLEKLGFELTDSLTYEDHQVKRVGHLYRLSHERYLEQPTYQYHYA